MTLLGAPINTHYSPKTDSIQPCKNPDKCRYITYKGTPEEIKAQAVFAQKTKAPRNNERVGISTELAVTKAFGITPDRGYSITRGNEDLIDKLAPILFQELMAENIIITKHIAGGSSPQDFQAGEKTVSLKSHYGLKGRIAPQVIGQAGLKIHFTKLSHLYEGEVIPETKAEKEALFKKAILADPEKFMKEYWLHTFSCDHLVLVGNILDNNKAFSNNVQITVYGKEEFPKLDKTKLKFRKTISEWNESNRLFYDEVELAEVQVHTNREALKFRWTTQGLAYLVSLKAQEQA